MPDRKTAGLRWRVVIRHKNDPHVDRDLMARLDLFERDDLLEVVAKRVLTQEEFLQWKTNLAWENKSRPFSFGGREGAYGLDAEALFYNGMVRAFSTPFTWPLINEAVRIFGEPVVEGNKMTFTPFTPPYHYNEDTQGVVGAKRTFPYKYDSWQSGGLPAYKRAKWYSFKDLVKGVVVDIGPKRYRVSYPLAQYMVDEKDVEYGEYPNPSAPVYIEETTDRLTRASSSRESKDVQFFGKPSWQQSERYPVYEGRIGYVLFTLHDGWGDGGSTNILFCIDKDGAPVRVFHEASCW